MGKVVRWLHDFGRNWAVNVVAASEIVPGSLRCAIYRKCGIAVSTKGKPLINPGCHFLHFNVRFGSECFVNTGCFFLSDAPITIGERCNIAMQVMFCTASHELGDASRRAGPPTAQPIRVGDGCWIGTRAIILPGVTVGEGCVIAAGALVTKDCAPNGLYAGTPARRVRELAGEEQPPT